jgi:hypothetical protein
MKPSRVRLAVCALLFLGWISWLVYLSATTTRPVVLSRPQFLAADLYVIADLQQGYEPRVRGELPGLLAAAPAAAFPASLTWEAVRLSANPPQADVAAEPKKLNAPAPKIRIREVVWPAARPGGRGGAELFIPNLPLCGPRKGWAEPGEYILPLSQIGSVGKKFYVVTPIPRSPGFYGAEPGPKEPGRIYPATPTARRELQDLVKEFHGRDR